MSFNSFNKKAVRPTHASANRLIDQVIAERHNLKGQKFVVPRLGNTAITVMTVDEVFKAPVYASEREAFTRELAVLSHLQGKDMAADVARVTYVAKDGGFYGMKRMHGEALTPRLLATLSAEEREKLAGQIGIFNARLGLSMTEEERHTAGLRPLRQSSLLLPHHVQETLELDFVCEELSYLSVADRLAAWYARHHDETQQMRKMMMLHTDMHDANFLYNARNGALSVIDLGGGDVVQVEEAFALMQQYYPDDFVATALESFSRESGVPVTLDDVLVFKGLRILRHAPQTLDDATPLWAEIAPRVGEALDRLEAADSASKPAPASQSRRDFGR